MTAGAQAPGTGTRPGYPGERAYATATRVFNLAAPARPAAAVTVTSVAEVRRALDHARAEGMGVRVHTTGHASAAVAPPTGALLLRTRFGDPVTVDAAARVARVPAGATWGDVVPAAAEHGLAAAHGSSALVGAVGYLLGGGVSFYGRRAGLAVNTVRAVELVTADGAHRRVDASSEPELFWALRGGGGGFGVVTAVEIELFPAAEVVTGAAFWPAAQAPELLARWLSWTRGAPEEAATSLRILHFPADAPLPPSLRGGPLVCVDGAVLAAESRDAGRARTIAADLLRPLRAVAEPVLDTWRPGPAAAVLSAHMDAPEPLPFRGDHLLLRDVDGDAAAAFLRLAGEGSGSPLVLAGFRQLGGAFARPAPGGGALTHVDARFAYLGSGAPFGGVTEDDLRDHCTAMRAALTPWDSGWTIPSLVEDAARPQRHLDVPAARAVHRVRTSTDPDGLFTGDIARGARTPL
ncbi:FAD-binding protein [Actinomadura flavalba]|uniref:FAD-binding protein n=1 Tax=Actinomadura flavalba TaxID=1120938 RepID=UPI000367E1ED|nr:FAD-binding protein [Actinomadura flavalba]